VIQRLSQREWNTKRMLYLCTRHGETDGRNSWNMVELDTRLVLCVSIIHSVPKYDKNTCYVFVNNRHRSIAQLVHANKQTINYKRSGQTLRCSDRIHISAVRRIISLLFSISLFISYLIVITVLQIARLQALSGCIQAAAK
jgi:hypothetical protein